MKRSLDSQRILLTGASSGIGAALAVQLAAKGAKLVTVARREDRLKDISKKTGAKFVAGDITNSAVRQLAVDTVLEQFGGLDILVNNAGTGATATLEETSSATARQLLEVNFFAPLELTQLALPHLKRGNRPLVVNLSSIVGLRGVPHYGVYGAAKFAVNGLSEAIRAELHRYGIDVLVVCPGTTRTEFFDVLVQKTSAPNFPEHKPVSAEFVAAKIISAMQTGKHRLVPHLPSRILDQLNRYCPAFVDWLMTRYA